MACGIILYFRYGHDDGGPVALMGFVFLGPAVLVVVVGCDNIFNFMARKFDLDPAQRERDGAFIASLVDNVTASVGDKWWVHHGRNDLQNSKFDPRRNWEEGIVIEVTSCGDQSKATHRRVFS